MRLIFCFSVIMVCLFIYALISGFSSKSNNKHT